MAVRLSTALIDANFRILPRSHNAQARADSAITPSGTPMPAPTAVSLQDEPSAAVAMIVVDPVEGHDLEEEDDGDGDGDNDKAVEDAVEDNELEVDVARPAYPTTAVAALKVKGASPLTQAIADPLLTKSPQQNSDVEIFPL
jgi:hypothetical protein